MHHILKTLSYSAVATLNTGALQKRSPIDVIIPFHHLVSDEPVPYIQSLYAFSNSRQFEAGLDYLLRNFQALTLPEVIERQQEQQPQRQNGPPRKKGFLICFDDGLRQVYEIAAPILLRKGVPAALFINPSFVDNKEIFYSLQKGWLLHQLAGSPRGAAGGASGRAQGASLSGANSGLLGGTRGGATSQAHLLRAAGQLFGRPIHTIAHLRGAIRSINYLDRHLIAQLGALLGLDPETALRNQRPFMTLDQIKGLNAKGFAIGAHSMDHPLYSLIPPEEQISQTLQSVRWVTDNFHLPYRAFAFPHVDTGVGVDFFRQLVPARDERSIPARGEQMAPPSNERPTPQLDKQPPFPGNGALDLILGNRTGMLESHPRVLHRFIGENPAIPMEKMVKAVMAYSILRKYSGRSFVQRGS
jgi:peptidoglycan/xylan/chitin deacetylase (PgdA/CDA1 family)